MLRNSGAGRVEKEQDDRRCLPLNLKSVVWPGLSCLIGSEFTKAKMEHSDTDIV